MEMVILGLLVGTPQTLYQLNQNFERSVSLFYAASYGSLKYALNNLLSKEYIVFKKIREGKRTKKIYTITAEGNEALLNWLDQDFADNKLEVASLSRLFLLGLVKSNAQKKLIIERILKKHKIALEKLRFVEKVVINIPVAADKLDIRHFKLKTLEYGIGSYQFAIGYYQNLLNELEEV